MGPFVMVICAAIIFFIFQAWKSAIETVRGWIK